MTQEQLAEISTTTHDKQQINRVIICMSTNLKIPSEFDAASRDERIAFVQQLWDRIAQDPNRVPIPAEHKRVLDERLDAYQADPRPGRPWSDVRDQLLAKLRSS